MMRLAALVVLMTLLALAPAMDPVWPTGLHGTGHSYCPVHANPGILGEGDGALALPPAQMLGTAGMSIHLLDWTRPHFVPPRA